MTHHPLRTFAALVAIVSIALAGCTNGDGPEPEPTATETGSPTALVPGACLAGEPVNDLGDVAVVEENVVPCEEAHVYELLAMQDVPREYFETGDPSERDRARLQQVLGGTTRTSQHVKFAAFARAYCAISLQRATGLNEIELNGKRTADLQAVLHSDTSTPFALLNDGDEWLEQPLLICVNRFTERSSTPATAPTSAVEGLVSASLLEADYPLERRSCIAVDAAGVEAPIDCARPHYGERTIDIDVTAMFDPEQIEAESQDVQSAFSDEFQEEIDQACTDVLSLLIGEDYDADDLVGRGHRGPLGWGQGGHVNLVECHVGAADEARFDLPPGSVFGLGDADIELTPIG